MPIEAMDLVNETTGIVIGPFRDYIAQAAARRALAYHGVPGRGGGGWQSGRKRGGVWLCHWDEGGGNGGDGKGGLGPAAAAPGGGALQDPHAAAGG